MAVCLKIAGFVLLVLIALPVFAETHPPFQSLVDEAKPGDELRPHPGTYAGPVVIDKPLTIDGGGKVTIDNAGKGTVVRLDTDGAVLRGLHLTNSGALHNDLDAGIQVRGKYNVIKDNVIDDCLFGIDLKQADSNIIRRNRISSKPFALGLRGDAIRLWYSMRNKITHNVIHDARDTVVWYSRDNVITHNDSARGRYALHFMYSHYNRVEHNRYHDNSVGVFLMYSNEVELRHNHISHGTGPTGMGIGFKEASDIVIEGKYIVYCATGIYLDLSPFEPDSENRIIDNRLAYNGVGVMFHNDWQGNVFRENHFKGNLAQVAVQGATTASRNEWQANRWNPIPVRDHPYELELCDLCVRQCPIEIQIAQCEMGEPPSANPAACPPKHAITLKPVDGSEGSRHMTPVVAEGCVGCGVCEMVCPAEPAAIVVDEGKVWGQV